jgi:hypothetical protein
MTRRDRFWMWLAWLLPRRLVYMAAIRMASEATTGPYSFTVVPELTLIDGLHRWQAQRELTASGERY